MKPQRSTLAASIAMSLLLCACSAPPETSRETAQTNRTDKPAGQADEVFAADGVDPAAAGGPQALTMRNERPVAAIEHKRQAARRQSAETEQAAKAKPAESSQTPAAPLSTAAPVVARTQIAELTAGDAMSTPAPAPAIWPVTVANREHYEAPEAGPVKQAASEPVSTFSIDVDTGAYSNLRRLISAGQLPPADAVRIEEMLNYFDYDYPSPAPGAAPFQVSTELAPAPWNAARQLLLIGIQGFDVAPEDVPASNLVFLIDTSGSMQSAGKLGLVREAMIELAAQLRPQDRVAIVTYAGSAGLVLASTRGDRRGDIIAALDQLQAGGSTNGGAGIELAYAIAAENFVQGGVNRVVLATDGDFNVGTVDQGALEQLVAARRTSGIALTTLGFGTGNYNDALAEQLADIGDGNHAYIDTINEARKVLIDELSSTMLTIAADVKVQIEFNPAVVAEYRLIGYDNRLLRREDFANDRVDAGEIGAGHDVTALYEIALVGSGGERLDALRYGKPSAAMPTMVGQAGELAHLRLRYKQPGESTSRLMTAPIAAANAKPRASGRLAFAAAVAAFGETLRGSGNLGAFDLVAIRNLAESARGRDPFGYRREFVSLVDRYRALLPAEASLSAGHASPAELVVVPTDW